MTAARKYFALLLVIINLPLFAQIKIKELPRERFTKTDSINYRISDTRSVISLSDSWEAYLEDEAENRAALNVPATFSGSDKLVFEKKFDFNREANLDKKKELVFLGVTYSCEVFLNDVSIHKHPGGELPFFVELNDELLNEKSNVMRVIVNADFDARNTIPLEQRYLFPDTEGGIVGEVLLRLSPAVFMSNAHVVSSITGNAGKGVAEINFRVVSHNPENPDIKGFGINLRLADRSGREVANLDLPPFDISGGISEVKTRVEIENPVLWSPANPHYYSYRINLTKNDSIIDTYSGRTGFYNLEKKDGKLLLNDRQFSFYGTGYVPYDLTNKSMLGKNKLAEELRQIKMTGFNAIRFSKVIPSPFVIEYCTELGLFVLVDLPLSSMPEHFAADNNFFDRASGRLRSIIETFGNSVSVAGFGVGSSYIANSPEHLDFINRLAESVNNLTNKKLYASFTGFQSPLPQGIDFAGIESLALPYDELVSRTETVDGNGDNADYIFSDVVYPTFNGGTNGYLNKFSREAQAKYFADIIDFVKKKEFPGLFFSSYYDYRGKYSSLFAGYSKNNVYNIGILGMDKGQNTLSYKVIKSKLNNGEKVNIPLGSTSDDAPILFILTGLFLSILAALLVNSKRKFREDVTRALFRPYNFFADIRDHRIISGFHSNILFLTLAGGHSLLVTNLLYFLRHNILLDKAMLSFASEPFLAMVSYLAWNPLEALVWLFFASVVFIPLVSLFFLGTTFFIRTKVMYSSIYYSTIWAFLPLALMLPLELVLYRVLVAGIANLYIYIVLGVFMLWLVQRLLKGIYVIFDVRAFSVYFATFLLVLLIFGGTYLYFHLTEETTFYLINAWKQYSVM